MFLLLKKGKKDEQKNVSTKQPKEKKGPWIFKTQENHWWKKYLASPKKERKSKNISLESNGKRV